MIASTFAAMQPLWLLVMAYMQCLEEQFMLWCGVVCGCSIHLVFRLHRPINDSTEPVEAQGPLEVVDADTICE